MSMSRAVVPLAPSSAPRRSSTDENSASLARTPASLSSPTRASRYTRVPRVTSAAPARSQSGEKPNARIDPSSTTFPPAFRTASFFGDCSTSPATCSEGRSTPPTSSTLIRSRFFAVAS
jgi:hypothetical protein